MKLFIHSQTSSVEPLNFGKDKWFQPTHCNGCNYLSMLGLNLIHVSKRGLWHHFGYHMFHLSKKRTCDVQLFSLPDMQQPSRYVTHIAQICNSRQKCNLHGPNMQLRTSRYVTWIILICNIFLAENVYRNMYICYIVLCWGLVVGIIFY